MNKNSVTKSSCLFSKLKLAVKITRSPNCTENLEVYFGRLASYRHWLKVITFLRRFLEKVQMRRLTLFKISEVHSHNPGIRILRVLPVKSKQTFPNASRKRLLLRSEAAGGGWLLPGFLDSRAGATTEATPAGVGGGPGVWRLHAPRTWACAHPPPHRPTYSHIGQSLQEHPPPTVSDQTRILRLRPGSRGAALVGAAGRPFGKKMCTRGNFLVHIQGELSQGFP